MVVPSSHKEELLNHIRLMKEESKNHIVVILHFDFEGWCTRFTNDNVRGIAEKID